MRKQTKLVAVTSAAALLAIGASMTSFAATGWAEEAGDWYYYDSDGYVVEDTWKKSGDQWFWLDSELGGAMATDSLIEDDDDLYYVDSNGAMVNSTWIKVVNEDQDDEDPAEYHYYYMASTGKAYKGNGDDISLKTIDGKRYAFDEDGKMLYGWVDDAGNRMSGEEDWNNEAEDVRYFGSWDDGSMKTAWQYIAVVDDDDDENYWFYFNTNGTRYYCDDDTANYETKKLNGIYYGFDERGVMVSQWNVESVAVTGAATPGQAIGATNWSYFNSPEDGARVTKGWFKVIPPSDETTFTADLTNENSFDAGNADDESAGWYYANGDGTLYSNGIKKISGKYYAFNAKGRMLSGLVLANVDESGNFSAVDTIDSDELDELMDGDYDSIASYNAMYYFGTPADSDGAMKTGVVTVELDGDNHTFKFATSGGIESKGRGYQGIDDNQYIYNFGKRIKASTDDKYVLVEVDATTSAVINVVESEIRAAATPYYEVDGTDVDRTVKVADINFDESNPDYYLVNTSGTITKSKSAAKDGAEWYYFVDDYKVVLYANDKDIKDLSDNKTTADNKFDDWK